MQFKTFKSPTYLVDSQLQATLQADPLHLPIHAADLPYRLTSTWQDLGCEIGIWQNKHQVLAWAVFQPPWYNLDFFVHPSDFGSRLPAEVFHWGIGQMKSYAQRIEGDFYGSVEFFADSPNSQSLIDTLLHLGFKPFDWSILRFEIDLRGEISQPKLPAGFTIRPLQEKSEVEAYVSLHRAAFGSNQMTATWRLRTLAHPSYRPELDLVLVNPAGEAVGFCISWLHQRTGQIEPLGVHPNYQGKGFGKALELAALSALHNAGAHFGQIDHASAPISAPSLSPGKRVSSNAMTH